MIEWFLDAVSKRGPKDAMHQRIAEYLARRDEPKKLHPFVETLAPVLATATGAIEHRVGLAPNSRGLMTMTYNLSGFRPESAGKGSEAFALSLLLDEQRDHGRHLGQCRHCHRFFLAPEQPEAGRKATGYCSDGCREAGRLQKGQERAAAQRAGMSVEEYRKAQAKKGRKR